MDTFDIKVNCKKCGSNNVHICRHLDYTGGLDEAQDYTGDIVLVCQDCYNTELMKLKYEKLW